MILERDIRQENVGAVKIGRAYDPSARLLRLQTGNPRDLVLLAVLVGDSLLESDLHRRFRDAALISGEWFDGGIGDAISNLGLGIADTQIALHQESGQIVTDLGALLLDKEAPC